MLFKLVCDLCETGKLPKGYKINKTVTISKRATAVKCENYRTIILTTHASKILNAIIHKRIKQTIESSLDEDQFDFRKERGTREALLSLQLIQSSRLRVGKPTFIAFVDLEKHFT